MPIAAAISAVIAVIVIICLLVAAVIWAMVASAVSKGSCDRERRGARREIAERFAAEEPAAKTEISSVGRLRAALAGLPDDQPIIVQVVATDGKCWSVFADFVPADERCSLAVITCHHPKLSTLP